MYEEKIQAYQKTQLKVQHSLALLNLSQSVVMITGQAIGALLCIKYVLDGKFTVGDYVMFGTYISQLYVPLNWFGTMYRMIQAAYVDTGTGPRCDFGTRENILRVVQTEAILFFESMSERG